MKDFYIRTGIGSSKYVVNYYDGVSTHKDGSKFYNIAIFKNKIKMNDFIKELLKKGFKTRGF